VQVHSYDPTTGQAAQGDIVILPIPAGIAIAKADEIKPVDGRLIIQEGEVSGHHHKILLPPAMFGRQFKQDTRILGDAAIMTDSPRLKKAFGGKKAAIGTARMYRDAGAVEAMVRKGILTRTDLAIGCLVIEGAPVTVSHEEHDGISVPPGNYYVGRQVESAGAEERVVAD